MLKPVALGITAGLMFAAMPAIADVKAGVDAWQQGDYARAIAEWRPLAETGDADAQFNMGQAAKLGRGVPADMNAAIDWYRKAAVQGHTRAEDNLGLLMFQQGDRAGAMPYLQRAAARGEPRAQYVVGTALFNGDLLSKDWVRAYAFMTRAATSGLAQATTSLQQMDKYVPDDQRKQGLALASSMEQGAAPAMASSAPVQPARVAVAPSTSTIRTTELPPSDLGRPTPERSPLPEKVPHAAVLASKPAPKPTPAKPAPPKAAPKPVVTASAPAPSASGGWRVQLGAFSADGNARSLWGRLTGQVKGLSAYQPYLVKSGAITRLQAGPLSSSVDAARLCASIKAAGADCIPKKM